MRPNVNSITLSAIASVVEFTVVVVPFTIKLPSGATFRTINPYSGVAIGLSNNSTADGDWTVITTNRLMDNKIVVPAPKTNKKTEKYIGAYVKEPLLGMHKWVASFDLNSLYPHLIIQYNISPDTIIEPEKYTSDHRKILSQRISIDSMLDQSVDTSLLDGCTLTPNGQLFSTKHQGFLPKIMEEMYNDRTRYKKEAIKAKKELEKVKEEIEKEAKNADKPLSKNGDRVFSDIHPFHLECMKQGRIFCPHMKETKDEEFEVGTFKELRDKVDAFILSQYPQKET